jgi:hypothetical protein
MADQPRDKGKTGKTKDESPKKQAETVNLTAEELRAISGGVSVVGGPAPPKFDPAVGTVTKPKR